MMKMAPVNVKINPLGGAICVALVLATFFYAFGFPSLFSYAEPRVSMKEILSAGIVLARRGGDRVVAIRRADTLQEKVKGKTKEGAQEMVSDGDLQSHRAIVHGFGKAFPGLAVVSEEHETKPVDFSTIPDIDKHLKEVDAIIKSDQSIPKNEILVWIDPLDATQEYTEMEEDGKDLLHFVTTMVCVAVNGQPTIGIIHEPFANKDQGETTWAWVDHGHSANLKKAEEREKGPKDPHRIIVSRSHKGSVEELAQKSFGKDVVITGAGGAGYKTLEVINGNQDAYVHKTLIKKWDICAGNAILSALDGKMTTLKGKYIDYSSGKSPKNEGGLLASVYSHSTYLDKLSADGESEKT